MKIGGIPWFNAMEDGITRRAAELGVTAEMIGPVSADPALQVQAIEDVAENVDNSRSTALDLIGVNADLRGFLAFGSQGPIGAGRAVEERRKTGEIHVMGPFSPGQGRSMIESGVLTGGFMWNPAQAGEVFVTLGTMLANGEAIEAGTDIPGLGVVDPDFEGRDIITDNLLEINAETVGELADMGL